MAILHDASLSACHHRLIAALLVRVRVSVRVSVSVRVRVRVRVRVGFGFGFGFGLANPTSRSVRDAKPARTVAAGQVVEVAADATSAPERTSEAAGATSTFSRGVAARAFAGVRRAIGNRACVTSALAPSVLSSRSTASAVLIAEGDADGAMSSHGD